MKSQKTTLVKNNEIKREWYEFDASQFSLGRLATQVAPIRQPSLSIQEHRVACAHGLAAA